MNSTRERSPSMMARPTQSVAGIDSRSDVVVCRNSYWMAAEAAGAVITSSKSAIAGKFFFINNLEVLLSITRSDGNTIFGWGVGAAHVQQEVCSVRARRCRAGVSSLRGKNGEARLARRCDPQSAACTGAYEHVAG